MATYQILYWQDIPSQVIAQGEGRTHKVLLSGRFQELIDSAAMKKNLAGSEDYINAWVKGPKTERPGSAAAVAQAVADELESRFDAIRSVAAAR